MDASFSYINGSFKKSFVMDDLTELKNAAHEGVNALKCLTPQERSNHLKAIAFGIEKSKEEFVALISNDAKKTYFLSQAEVNRAIQCFLIAAEETLHWPEESFQLESPLLAKPKMINRKSYPLGIVLGFTPFNFPLNLVAHKLAPALAAGCAVIIKPSPKTPQTATLLAKIISETELPKGAFQLVNCNDEFAQKLLEDDFFDLFSFTGSDKVGWKIKQALNKKKVVLELGGTATAIVTEDADLELALEKCLFGAFAYAGQVCIHTQHILVHQSLFKNFAKEFILKTKELNFESLERTKFFNPMISEEAAIRVESWINEAITEGAQVLCGGKHSGSLMEPTVLINVKHDSKLFNEEVFGPVVCLHSYNTKQEVIDFVNQSNYAIQASIFTKDIAHVSFWQENLKMPNLIINDATTFRHDNMPYGGIKDSGVGVEGIRYAMREMLEFKSVIV